MKIFVTVRDDVKESAIEYIKSLSGVYDIKIEPHKKSRSHSQNSLYHMWVGIISKETGNDHDDLCEIFKMKFLGTEKKNFMGLEIERPKSTKKLNTKEFTNYLDKIDALAISLGLTLPKPAGIYDEAYGLK